MGIRATATALLLTLSAPPAWAEGAIVVGYWPDDEHSIVYGYAFDFPSRAAAARAALAYCAKRGNGGKILTDNLGALCFSLAAEAECGAYGYAYKASPAEAKRQSLAERQKQGGKNCETEFMVCDAGAGGGSTYTPPSLGWPNMPRCYVGPSYTPKYEAWECPP